jgi:hypothetical protein
MNVDAIWLIKQRLEPVSFAKKPWLKILFANLLWEKNTVPTEKQTEKYEL